MPLLKYYARITIAAVFLALFSREGNCSQTACKYQADIQNKDSLKSEIEDLLKKDLSLWYPLSADSVFGGFYSDINYRWEIEGSQMKMIVTQARHLWTASNAAGFFHDNEKYLNVAGHAFRFLKEVMWDKNDGGFFDLVTREGKPVKENDRIIKRAYGNAFAIYGLAAYYKAAHDTSALNLAVKTFDWLEKHSYDPRFGGYYQFVSSDGKPMIEGYRSTPPKDQNSSIHLLECFTELYQVWPDNLLKDRLASLLYIIRDKMAGEKGYLNLFFDKELNAVSFRDSSEAFIKRNIELDHVSFGHDVETAYLMQEASKTLGIKDDAGTHYIAKKMVDHALSTGWDNEHGGLYDGGYYFKGEERIRIVKESKEWWVHAEALNSFLMMAGLYPDDPNKYYDRFLEQWGYIKNYLLDKEYGGWYYRGLDNKEGNRYSPKSTIWKCNYHTSRALINCLRMLSEKSN